MDAIILAAGTGSRLGQGRPKCLCEVGGRTLIEHQLAALEAVGAEPVVVLGYRHEEVRALLDGVRVVVNERFASTNSLYSFHLAEAAVDDDAVILNADVLFDPAVLEELLDGGTSALACDSSSGGDDEHMKIAARDGTLTEMRKDLPAPRCLAENVGLLYLDRPALADAFMAARSLVFQGRGATEWLASAVNRIAPFHQIGCVDIAGLPWVEIDFPADLAHAEQQVWPQIAERMAEAACMSEAA